MCATSNVAKGNAGMVHLQQHNPRRTTPHKRSMMNEHFVQVCMGHAAPVIWQRSVQFLIMGGTLGQPR